MTLPSIHSRAAGAALLLAVLLLALSCPPASCQCQEQTREIQVSLPMYEVTSQGGYDWVEIPGGAALNEMGMPIVPTYTKEFLLQAGERVQSVAIIGKGGFTNASGLYLPIFQANITAGGTIPSGSPGDGWFPGLDLAWDTWVHDNGTSTLEVTLYPFRYNANTMESSYCSQYTLELTYVTTAAGITGISSDEAAYDPGETVALEVSMQNPGEAEDFVVGVTILRSGSLELVDALPLRTVHDLQGASAIQMSWTETDVEPGEYIARAEMNDTSGHWLSTATLPIAIGIPKIEITAFSASPQHFEIGDEVVVELTVKNIGAVEATGTCIVQIRGDDGLVQGTQINFTGLNPNQPRTFRASWDTTNATEGEIYTALAYILYGGQSSDIRSALLSTNLPPLPQISFSPSAPWTGLNVTFDASLSHDPDGTITAFVWDFGDYTSSNGSSVTHVYLLPRNYTVTLTAVDDKGAEGKTTAAIEVVRGYFLNVSSNIGAAVEGSGLYPEGGVAHVSAPQEVAVPGIMGTLGSKYVFKQWSGASNLTNNVMDMPVDYEASHLGLQAIYQEQGSMALIAILAVVAVAIVVATVILLRSRRRRKPPGVPHKPKGT